MDFARAALLSITLGSTSLAAQAQEPAPPPAAYTPQPSPLVAPEPATLGYPTEPPVYYAPGYAPANGTPQAPPGYYGIETTPPDYPRPIYQAMQGRTPHAGSHEHEGFYLHLGTGIGAGGAAYKERLSTGVSSVRTRGIAITFDVGIGGRIVDNFILHGNATFSFFNARKKIDDVEDNAYDSIESTLWMLGAGGTYYVMPYNLYLTLVLGTGGFTETRDYRTFNVDKNTINSTAGFAGSLAIGKEWWVGGRGEWGIGAAIKGLVTAAPMQIANYDTTLIAHSITLEFSATLN